ncbi:MAG: MscL family protein [Ruminococcus callidus]
MVVGLIVGSAFTAIVNSLVDDILMPITARCLPASTSCLWESRSHGALSVCCHRSFLNTVITFADGACVFH